MEYKPVLVQEYEDNLSMDSAAKKKKLIKKRSFAELHKKSQNQMIDAGSINSVEQCKSEQK